MAEEGKRAKRRKRTAMVLTPALAVALCCLSALAQTSPPNNVEATSTPLIRPHGVFYDALGNYYIADTDQNVIRKVSTAGIITTVAGTGEQGYAGDGGLATAAMLDSPQGVAVDSSGNIYIADTHNNVIREVTASTGDISTIAGTGGAGYSGDGSTATAAMLDYPTAVAVDSSGNVYIADTNNHRIREITGTTINTVAGDGEQNYSGDGGLATAAGLDSPSGVAVDSAFNMYIGDTHNQRVRMVTHATGDISTIAGTGAEGYNGEGTATAVELARPRGVAVDGSGNVYLADSDNNMIRSISGSTLTTIAGSGLEGLSGDGGAATSAALDTPGAVAVSGGSVLFSDTENNLVRALNGGILNSTSGQSSSEETLVISGSASVSYGTGTLTATFSNGGNIATGLVTFYDGEGASPTVIGSALLVSNTASVSTGSLAVGTHTIIASYAGDSNNAAITSGVFVLSVTSYVIANHLWIGDSGGGTSAFLATGTPYLTSPESGGGGGVAIDNSGNVWSLNPGSNSVTEFSNTGSVLSTIPYTGGGLSTPTSLAIDGSENVWITNSNGTISEFNSSGTAVSPATGYTGGSGGNLSRPSSIAIDISGNLWISNSGSDTVTEVLGAAAPTVPISIGVANDTPASKP